MNLEAQVFLNFNRSFWDEVTVTQALKKKKKDKSNNE
jgi:hypothetical protein